MNFHIHLLSSHAESSAASLVSFNSLLNFARFSAAWLSCSDFILNSVHVFHEALSCFHSSRILSNLAWASLMSASILTTGLFLSNSFWTASAVLSASFWTWFLSKTALIKALIENLLSFILYSYNNKKSDYSLIVRFLNKSV